MNSTLEAALVLGRPVDGDGTSWSRQLSAADPAKAIGALRGGFALAVPLKDGTTVLGVDRFARETICYAESDQGVRFSARADELAGPSPELDPQAIYDYLFFHAIPSPRTIFKGVHRLPPATLALARGGKVDTRRYWTPHFAPSAGGDGSGRTNRRHHGSAELGALSVGIAQSQSTVRGSSVVAERSRSCDAAANFV